MKLHYPLQSVCMSNYFRKFNTFFTDDFTATLNTPGQLFNYSTQTIFGTDTDISRLLQLYQNREEFFKIEQNLEKIGEKVAGWFILSVLVLMAFLIYFGKRNHQNAYPIVVDTFIMVFSFIVCMYTPFTTYLLQKAPPLPKLQQDPVATTPRKANA